MNVTQKTAFNMIVEDARFLYAMIALYNKIDNNFMSMFIPYIGIFACGAEQWGNKMRLSIPEFTQEEKEFYTQLRQGHKLFEKSYSEYKTLLIQKLSESDDYFNKSGIIQRFIGYYNVGTDLCNGEYCGNTVLCTMYIPTMNIGDKTFGPWIKKMCQVAGKIASSFECTKFPMYKYNDNIVADHKDFHFFRRSPLKMNNDLGLLLFSVLCSINYTVEFIETLFVEELPQKFKYAYLQYYYLCDFVKDLNDQNGTKYYLNNQLYNRNFRNCLAHYGLGQFINEDEIIEKDILKGLTNKAFGKDYYSAKDELYSELKNLSKQIKQTIF